MYMLYLAALEILIDKYSGQERFTIGTPFSEREDLNLENTIGYLVNLLPIPCSVRSEQIIPKLLGKVREACLDAYSHHADLRAILKEIGGVSENPKPSLTRIVFQYFADDSSQPNLCGLEVSKLAVHSGTSKIDISFSLLDQNGEVISEIEYDSELFEHSTI